MRAPRFWREYTPIFDAILLLVAAAAALLLANTGLGATLHEFWQRSISFGSGLLHGSLSVERFVNDLLMALFFLVVGIEIKSEVLDGDLSSPRKAALPLVAAVGGMALPVAVYVCTAFLAPAQGRAITLQGWGIPMATDIVFATMILDLIGKRVPASLKVFLTALAVADDLGAMVVILFIGGHGLQLPWLIVALLLTVVLFLAAAWKVRRLRFYLPVGLLLLVACFFSGLHPTIAGVVLAFALPGDGYDEQRGDAHVCADSPLGRAEHRFSPIASYIVLPLFAFVNAGIALDAQAFRALVSNPAPLGVVLGLLVGKPLGVFGFSLAALKLKIAHLPGDLTLRQLSAAALLAGIGFTMSIFIANLSLAGHPTLLSQVKLAIIVASVVMGLGGYFYTRRL
jgi:NhaA family Na+:H+ antiporter